MTVTKNKDVRVNYTIECNECGVIVYSDHQELPGNWFRLQSEGLTQDFHGPKCLFLYCIKNISYFNNRISLREDA